MATGDNAKVLEAIRANVSHLIPISDLAEQIAHVGGRHLAKLESPRDGRFVCECFNEFRYSA
jgi:hypothetical protein